jgi:hypothetical protein
VSRRLRLSEIQCHRQHAEVALETVLHVEFIDPLAGIRWVVIRPQLNAANCKESGENSLFAKAFLGIPAQTLLKTTPLPALLPLHVLYTFAESIDFHDSAHDLIVVGRWTRHGDFYSAKQIPVLAHVSAKTGR